MGVSLLSWYTPTPGLPVSISTTRQFGLNQNSPFYFTRDGQRCNDYIGFCAYGVAMALSFLFIWGRNFAVVIISDRTRFSRDLYLEVG